MAIIISKAGVTVAAVVRKSRFEKEANLQEYIHQHPEAIPIYDIHENKRLFVAAREFGTPSGPIDALAVDADSDIYVIETKLYANADKRRVIAQALDYGAALWNHFSDFTEFVRCLDSHATREWRLGFREKAQECLALDEVGAEGMLAGMRDNLRSGTLKFVILMDRADDRLKELIGYVNLKSKFDIYAVELELYEYEDYRIVLPKLHGAEVKKENTPQPPRAAITESELLRDIGTKDPTEVQFAESLFARLREIGLESKETGSTISYGKNLGGDFVALLQFQAANVYGGIPAGISREIGAEKFVAYKKLMNKLGPFYPDSEIEDASAWRSNGPPYAALNKDLDSFMATVRSALGIVRVGKQD